MYLTNLTSILQAPTAGSSTIACDVRYRGVRFSSPSCYNFVISGSAFSPTPEYHVALGHDHCFAHAFLSLFNKVQWKLNMFQFTDIIFKQNYKKIKYPELKNAYLMCTKGPFSGGTAKMK